MNNFLYFNTPVDQFQTVYNNVPCSFKLKDIATQLPKNIATIRAVSIAIFTGLIAFNLASTGFLWPVIIGGAAFAGWTVYSNLYTKDPLMEAFYKICGGKDKFEQLPEISIPQNSKEKISTYIGRLEWDNLKFPIAKAKTLDGRNVVIIKGLTRNIEDLVANCQTKSILAFVEKIGPYDVPRTISDIHELVESIAYAIFSPFQGNTFGRFLNSSSLCFSNKNSSTYSKLFSSISGNMANELFAQMAPIKIIE